MTPRPTIRDVGRAAGVSHQTVSRVLNGSEAVHPATRERVVAAIEALGYTRNDSAAELARSRRGA
ncbi:LacI family transcriptional regulator [Microbacterium paludicola]|uniref:LacI family transcriptional regulator n=1 Tax=Microbacterium paludicola TaxID=300019 RepID=A0A4Y9FYV2_9MICO|nr:LacI family DNA-binding transcriptional regulator [Microbacterium paludicola]TFU33829.1 LacI family transcriptional regulator [Microbacterium paludicola]